MEEQEESQASGKCHRVQFSEETGTFGHDSDIGLRTVNDHLINVHLGFLQVHHRYEITFTLDCPHSINDILVVRNQDPPNLNAHVIELRRLEPEGEKRKYKIVLNLFAHKEKLLKEQITLHSSEDPLNTLTLAFHARSLGKGKGTPLLKNGIKCVGVEMEEESEQSDWQGFD